MEFNYNDQELRRRFEAWLVEETERERKRGAYWLTPEGRAEIAETWPEGTQSDAVPPVLLAALTQAEDEIARLRSDLETARREREGLLARLSGAVAEAQEEYAAAEVARSMARQAQEAQAAAEARAKRADKERDREVEAHTRALEADLQTGEAHRATVSRLARDRDAALAQVSALTAERDGLLVLAKERNGLASRVEELTAERDRAIEDRDRVDAQATDYCKRALAAERRVEELSGALAEIRDMNVDNMDMSDVMAECAARALLAQTGAAACPECGGSGKLGTGTPNGEGGEDYEKCHVCDGTGDPPAAQDGEKGDDAP